MSAISLPESPPFLDGLIETDRFLAVIKCIRSLQMHSILVPEIRTLEDLGLRLYVHQLVSNQRDVEAQILAGNARKNERLSRPWGPDSDVGGNFHSGSSDTVDGDHGHDSESDSENGTMFGLQHHNSPSAEGAGPRSPRSEADEMMIRVDDDGLGSERSAEYPSDGKMDEFCMCEFKFGMNDDFNRVASHDLKCPIHHQ